MTKKSKRKSISPYPAVPNDSLVLATSGKDGKGKGSQFRNPRTGEWETLEQCCRRLGITRGAFQSRLRRGWSLEDAMNIPGSANSSLVLQAQKNGLSRVEILEIALTPRAKSVLVWEIPLEKAKRLEVLRRKLGFSQQKLVNVGLELAIAELEKMIRPINVRSERVED